MDALEFLIEWKRMCKAQGGCNLCPLNTENSMLRSLHTCSFYLKNFPEQSIVIVEKWSKEHPSKTILQDFLEKYPKALVEDGAFPAVCPFQLGYETESEKDKNAYCESTARDSCRMCWNRPLEEVENND